MSRVIFGLNPSLSVDYPEDFLVCSYIANLLCNEKGLEFSHHDLIDAIKNISPSLLLIHPCMMDSESK